MTENTLTPQPALELAKSHSDDGAYDQAKAILEGLARVVPQEPVVWKLMGAATFIIAVVIRVAQRHWWASRRVTPISDIFRPPPISVNPFLLDPTGANRGPGEPGAADGSALKGDRGVNAGDRPKPRLAAGTDDGRGNLTTVGNQDAPHGDSFSRQIVVTQTRHRWRRHARRTARSPAHRGI